MHVDDAALLELEPEVVALARAFADAAEHRHAAVLQRDVVDQLHDDDGLADAGAAEQADLAALQIRLEQVDDLDAGLEHLQLGRLLLERRRRRGGSASAPSTCTGRSGKSTGSPSTFSTRPSVSGPDRHRNRLAEIDRRHAALHAVGRLHRDRAHAVLAEVLLDFGDDVDRRRSPCRLGLDAERVVDFRQVAVLELDVDHRPDDLNDFADVFSPICSRHSVSVLVLVRQC